MARHPHGYSYSITVLAHAPTLIEAYSLMPEISIKGMHIDAVRATLAALHTWEREILLPAIERERAGLNDQRPVSYYHADPRAAESDSEGQAALALLSQDASSGGSGGPDRPDPLLSGGADSLPRRLDVYQVAGLSGCGPDTVRRAAYLTRKGLARPGSPNYLPRDSRVIAGYRRDDVVAWLRARGQLRGACAEQRHDCMAPARKARAS